MLKILKTCPLVIGTVILSIILAIVFCVTGKDDKNDIAAEETPPVVTTETPTIAPVRDDLEQLPMGYIGPPQKIDTSTMFQTIENDDYFNDALFIGDSRTVGLGLYGALTDRGTFFASVGMNLSKVLTEAYDVPPESGNATTLENLLNENTYGKIYLCLGINDLGMSNAYDFGENYAAIVDTIRAGQNDAIIYVEGILHVSAARDAQGDSISNEAIDARNLYLERLAAVRDNVYYIDPNDALCDENGYLRSDLTSDGVHLTAGSLTLWEDYLRENAIIPADSTTPLENTTDIPPDDTP